MATILRAYNDLGQKFDLDVYNEQQFLLDISAIESGNLGKVFGISSQTFTLPPTNNNNAYFGNLYDLGATYPSGSLTQTSTAPTTFIKTMPCQVLNDGVQIFDGKLYLESVITDEDGNTTYNVNVVNETVDFKYLIQDLTFGDLDWSDYNHDYTYANITASWANGLFGGDVVYPLAEYGGDASNDTTTSLLKNGGAKNTFTNGITPLLVSDFKPAIRVNAILNKIFASLDYKYTSSLFDSAYGDTMYVLSTRDNTRGTSYTNPISQSFEARVDITQTIPDFTPTAVDFANEIYDNAGNYNPATSVFTATANGNYSFDVKLLGQLSGVTINSTPRSAIIELYINGSPSATPAVFYNLKGLGNTFKVMTANFSNVPLTSGDTIEVYVTFDTEDGGEQLDIRASVGTQFSYWTLYQGPLTSIGGNVVLGAVFNPEESVLAFLNGLIQKFNLVIEPLRDNPKVLTIEPFNTWVDNGTQVDWTDKVDRSVKWEIRHPMANQPKNINFSDVEDKDEFNQYSVNAIGKVFGSTIYQSESDLAAGERKIGTYFAPTPMKYIEGTTNFIVPQIYTLDNGAKKRYAFKPRLLHYLGLQNNYDLFGKDDTNTNSQNEWYFRDESGNVYPQSQYPQFHHVSALNDTNAKDLHFNNPQHWEYHQNYTSARTIHDAVYEYWSYYINELYDIDGRLLTLNVDLKPTDIPKIRLNDKIFIDGQYYRINKISGANLTNEQSTKVELIKSLPRKLRYPRRRIFDSTGVTVGVGYKDIFAGDVSVTGGVVYNDYNSGEVVTGSIFTDQAGYRDGFFVYSGSIQVGTTDKPKPTTNVILGSNYVDDRASDVIVVGNGNIVGGDILQGHVVGNENNLTTANGNVSVFGDYIATTGSVESVFIVSTTTSSVLADNVSNVVAINPTQTITANSVNKAVIGNGAIEGNYFESYLTISGSSGLTYELTGSNFNYSTYYLVYTGSEAGYTSLYLIDPTSSWYDSTEVTFITDGSVNETNYFRLINTTTPSAINGGDNYIISSSYATVTLKQLDGKWIASQGGGAGGGGTTPTASYGNFYSTQSQPIEAPYFSQSVNLDSTYISSSVYIASGSRIYFDNPGVYQFSYIAQLQNTDNAIHDAVFWVKYNGNDYPNSTTYMSVPARKSSGEPSYQLMSATFTGEAQNANDYIELYWTGDSITLSLFYTGSGVLDGEPATPSVIANVISVGGGSGGGTATAPYATASFGPTTSYIFNHNLGSQLVVVQAYDTSYNQIIPQNIELTSINQATITFNETASGYVIATRGGGTSIISGSSIAFPYTGSAQITGSLIVEGSTTSTTGFTGSLQGTASFASTASIANRVVFNPSDTIFNAPSAVYSITDADNYSIKQLNITSSGLNVIELNITGSTPYVKIQPIIYLDNYSGSAYTDTQFQIFNTTTSSISLGLFPLYSGSTSTEYYSSLNLSTTDNGATTNFSGKGKIIDVNSMGHLVTDYQGTMYISTGDEEQSYSSYRSGSVGTLELNGMTSAFEYAWDASFPSNIVTGSQWFSLGGQVLSGSTDIIYTTSSLPYYVNCNQDTLYYNIYETSSQPSDVSVAATSTFMMFNVDNDGTIFDIGGHATLSSSIQLYVTSGDLYLNVTSSIGQTLNLLVTSSFQYNQWYGVGVYTQNTTSSLNPFNVKTWLNGLPMSSGSMATPSNCQVKYGTIKVGGTLLGTNTPDNLLVGQFFNDNVTNLISNSENVEQFQFVNNIYNYGL